jgi:hypothetical protein
MMREFPLLNAGNTGGDYTTYTRFIEGWMWNSMEFDAHLEIDMPLLQHFLWSGGAERIGVNWRMSACAGRVLSMRLCMFEQVPMENHAELMNVVTKGTKRVVPLLHQYPVYPNATLALFRRCGFPEAKLNLSSSVWRGT